MIAFVNCRSNLVPLLEGQCSSNPCTFEFSVFLHRTASRSILEVFLKFAFSKQKDSVILKTVYLFFAIQYISCKWSGCCIGFESMSALTIISEKTLWLAIWVTSCHVICPGHVSMWLGGPFTVFNDKANLRILAVFSKSLKCDRNR